MFMIIILYIAVIASAETYNTACGGYLAPLYAVKKHWSGPYCAMRQTLYLPYLS